MADKPKKPARPAPAGRISVLPPDFGSLNLGLPLAPLETIFVKGPYGGRSVAAQPGLDTLFGRNVEEVHVCIGGADTSVSRKQGVISYTGSRWMVTNLGQRPIRLPGDGGRVLLQGHEAPVPKGFAPLIIMARGQEHVLEVRIATGLPAPATPDGPAVYSATTYNPDVRELDDDEEKAEEAKLVLICLAQHYLRNDPHAQPLTWAQVASELSEIRPGEEWDGRKAARIVTRVRKRLSEKYHVTGLFENEDEVTSPFSDAFKQNLINDLLFTGTLVPEHVGLLARPFRT